MASIFGGGVDKEDFEFLRAEEPDAERLLADIHDAYGCLEKGRSGSCRIP